jgi:hypothetical protein
MALDIPLRIAHLSCIFAYQWLSIALLFSSFPFFKGYFIINGFSTPFEALPK